LIEVFRHTDSEAVGSPTGIDRTQLWVGYGGDSEISSGGIKAGHNGRATSCAEKRK
jgi:hypothetical protein